ncbi:MAG: hypothetical protein ACJAYB_003386 [Psychromonas sp.]|jgi:hypothetical protein
MLVKFNSRGKGGGFSPLKYLLGDFGTVDGKMPSKAEQDKGIGKRSVKPLILRGDAEQTKQLIDGLSFKRNYTSGTLSFTESNISAEQKNKIMDDYQNMLLAGLDANQYDVLWVEHRDKNRLELNFLIPNVELVSGKRLQPYFDKADRKRVNAWQQVTNQKYGLTDPHDPCRKRAAVTAHDLPSETKEAKLAINKAMTESISSGFVSNREDVLQQLREWEFEIANEKPKSISIKNPKTNINLRLSGGIYERDFELGKEGTERIERAEREYKKQREQRYEEARTTLDEAYKRKCEYNTQRYSAAAKGDNKTKQAEPAADTKGIVQGLAAIRHGRNSRRLPSSTDINNSSEIQHSAIKEVVSKNVRCKSRISTCIKTVIDAVRAAVQRSESADSRTRRANNIANELANERFKQQKLKQQQRGPDEERRSFRL